MRRERYLRDHAGLFDPGVLEDWSAEAEDELRMQAAAVSAAQLHADTLTRDQIADSSAP